MAPNSNGVNSYVNNLGVRATFWYGYPGNMYQSGAIRVGGSSSDVLGAISPSDYVCTGDAHPNVIDV
ncbi:hypothetical protein [Streptomyces sp. NPDC059247]|uniref:hypothetical protein n=1 Tax=Streptomyces sp. NPDC059247 TaxID=3346790 RepID=UPI0036D1AAEF